MEEYLNVELILPPDNDNLGISSPLLIVASDGKRYYLKNYKVKQDGNEYTLDAAFFQESLAYKLAEFLNIPSPSCATIYIDEQTLNSFPDLRFKNKFTSGIYLASEYVENSSNDLNTLYQLMFTSNQPYFKRKVKNFFDLIENKDDLSKILYFDILTMNADRFTNLGNLIFQNQEDRKKTISIDYGFCFFNPFWDIPLSGQMQKIKCLQNEKDGQDRAWETIQQFYSWSSQHNQTKYALGLTFQFLNKNIYFNKGNPFKEIHEAAMTLTPSIITSMLNEIPDEWVVGGDQQRQAYLFFLQKQLANMTEVLDLMNNNKMFSNNTQGGLLKWEKEQSMSTQ
ncbi:MAG TPA: hypothetical protein H9803_01195 [Candidatus Ligilactobacillus excrementavium]|nr:hypothetical protein [Candidatus Ligilactobacillus excrementavium]